MSKKIVLIVLLGIFCGFTYIFILNTIKTGNNTKETLDNQKFFHAKMAFVANSLDEMYNQSPIIVEATIGDNIGDVEFGSGAYFTFT